MSGRTSVAADAKLRSCVASFVAAELGRYAAVLMPNQHPSIDYLRELTSFTLSLAERGIVIDSAQFYYGSFGSLILEYGSETHKFKLVYDGRDNYLSLSQSRVFGKWSSQREWSKLAVTDVGDKGIRGSIELASELIAKYPPPHNNGCT